MLLDYALNESLGRILVIDENAISFQALESTLKTLELTKLCEFCNNSSLVEGFVFNVLRIYTLASENLKPISLVILQRNMRESSANILIEKIRKVFDDMREETGLPLVEPTFVLLASYIEPNEREYMR